MGKIAIIVEIKTLEFKEQDLFIDFQGKSKFRLRFKCNFRY